MKAREGVLGTSWPDPRPPPHPDLRAQAPLPPEAEILEVEQRTFVFLWSEADSVSETAGTDPAGHQSRFMFESKNDIWAISWA